MQGIKRTNKDCGNCFLEVQGRRMEGDLLHLGPKRSTALQGPSASGRARSLVIFVLCFNEHWRFLPRSSLIEWGINLEDALLLDTLTKPTQPSEVGSCAREVMETWHGRLTGKGNSVSFNDRLMVCNPDAGERLPKTSQGVLSWLRVTYIILG